MNIAIIGAGLAGLSCALTLEKHGYSADIFEKRKKVGDRPVVGEVMSPLLHRPIDDAIKYLSEYHDIHLKPTTNIQRIFVHSPNETSFIEGHLGHTNKRGKDKTSYEKQLAEQVKSPIHLKKQVQYEEISKQYTHVVLATGDPLDTQSLQSFDTAFKATFAGAIVKGEFVHNEVHTWYDSELVPKGLGYFLPFSNTEGHLVLVYPKYKENLTIDKGKLWKAILKKAEQTLKQKLKVSQQFDLDNYVIGKSKYPRIGNTFFVGNCFGAIDPFLGFGQFTSILTGIYAAQDLCGISNYEEDVQILYKNYHDSLSLRRKLESLNNDQLDLITKSLQYKPVRKLLTGSNINLLRVISTLTHPSRR
ncbi:FAD-dependent dehydrogenase [Thalassobacillus devorans]|uniref:FAD-dependent dehydrogenase n=1 Tax=Thalassobacillus devorans TaxID=279813 RepID=A0ABQ1PS66_9BACI|nr:NAD(P)/FAD-dependent oxidoreductase [Thalassobacillus devorans]NIK30537.1 flavin-dependent dehydrogenase [Thalassobacillus devorans]GGD02149.1 FAD-dependent dehydrogenase [Thalassobacillus devorans]